jgi:hypothetical protein
MEYRSILMSPHSHKPLGAYLVEAGLLSEAQVAVALTDQSSISMSLGEILVTRGWVKQQTIEYLMQKVILPERETKHSKPELEFGLAKQKPKQTEPSLPAVERTISAFAAASDPKVATPALTSKDKSGVNWIG